MYTLTYTISVAREVDIYTLLWVCTHPFGHANPYITWRREAVLLSNVEKKICVCSMMELPSQWFSELSRHSY